MAAKNTVRCSQCGRFFDRNFGEYLVSKGRYLCPACTKKRAVLPATPEKRSYESDVRMAVAMGEMTPEQATIATYRESKAKLIWGIVLIVIGLVGAAGVEEEENTAAYLTTCFLLIAGGALLLFFHLRAKRRLKAAILAERQRHEKEADQFEQILSNAPKKCPNCGAATKGEVCEYCGSPLI